jgi:hypothetical protein
MCLTILDLLSCVLKARASQLKRKYVFGSFSSIGWISGQAVAFAEASAEGKPRFARGILIW